MQPGPDVLGEPGERLGVPGRAARLADQAVGGAVDAVGEQGGDASRAGCRSARASAAVVSRFATSLAGDLTASRTAAWSRPAWRAGPRRRSRTAGRRRAAPASTSAGYALTSPSVKTFGSGPKSQLVTPVLVSAVARADRVARTFGPELALQRGEVLACRDDLARRRSTRNVIRRCGGSLSRSKRVGRDPDAAQPEQLAGQGIPDVRRRGRRRAELGQDLAGHVGGGDELAAQRLGQRPDQLGDQFQAQAGDLPGELLRAGLVERLQRDVDGDAVGVAAPGSNA